MTPDPIEIGFAVGHPTGAGHFPGNPIIPGATLLDEVVRALTKNAATDGTAIVIRSAKFFHKLRPGETMRVQFHPASPGCVKFECHRTTGAVLLASGIIETGSNLA
jgi:3-hydroxyacyl-[acyl-carrier-protein] dehydratase